MNNKCLIIGSNSFLGNTLSKKLVEMNYSAKGIYHKNTDNLYTEIEHYPISKLDDLEDDYNFVFLISAYVPTPHEPIDKEKLEDINVNFVERVSNKFPSAKLIFTSSVSVYNHSDKVITEISDTNPLNVYGESKLKGEQIVKKHSKYAILRISSMYGKHMKSHTFLPAIIIQALEKRLITIYGKGERVQNYVFVDDVANYLIAAAMHSSNDTFLAVGEHSISNKDVAKLVSLNFKDVKIEFIGNDDFKSYVYDNAYTKNKLNIAGTTTLEIGLQKVVQWMKKQ